MLSVLAVAGAGGLVGCGDSGSGSGTGTAAASAMPAVPAPAGLALECVLPAPDATWEKARAQIGGAASFLPRSAGGLATVLLHFPIAVAEAIDGRSPGLCAATLSNDDEVPRFVVGIHLRWPDRLVDGLTKGAEARFTATTDPATQIAVLKARDPKDAVAAAGVLGNYLLIGARPEDLTAVGPYVARTMPARAREFPTSGVRIAGAAGATAEAPVDLLARVPAAAIGGPIAAAAARAWTRITERLADRLPFPLPIAEDAKAALAVLPDVEGAELRVTLADQGARLDVTAPLRKGSPGETLARSLATGDLAPLLALPKDTLAGALLRRSPPPTPPPPAASAASSPAATSSAAASSSATADAAPALPNDALAKILGITEPEDAAQLATITGAFDRARGDWLAAGFAFDGTGPSAYVRAAVRDPATLDGAIKDLLVLAEKVAPRDPVRWQKIDIMVGKTVLENIPGDVYRLRLARGGPASASAKAAAPPASPTETPGAIDVLFRRTDDVFVAATGYASRDALRAVLTAPTAENLKSVPELAPQLERLGTDVSFAAFLDPLRIAASRAGRPGTTPPAPIVLAAGRTTTDTVTLFLHLEAPSTALSDLARRLDP